MATKRCDTCGHHWQASLFDGPYYCPQCAQRDEAERSKQRRHDETLREARADREARESEARQRGLREEEREAREEWERERRDREAEYAEHDEILRVTGKVAAHENIRMAMECLKQNDIKRAKRLVEQALNAWPTSPWAWIASARLEVAQGTSPVRSLERALANINERDAQTGGFGPKAAIVEALTTIERSPGWIDKVLRETGGMNRPIARKLAPHYNVALVWWTKDLITELRTTERDLATQPSTIHEIAEAVRLLKTTSNASDLLSAWMAAINYSSTWHEKRIEALKLMEVELGDNLREAFKSKFADTAARLNSERIRVEASVAASTSQQREHDAKRESERQAKSDSWERSRSILLGVGTTAPIVGLIAWAVALHPWMIAQGAGWASYVFGPPLVLFVTQIIAALFSGSHPSESERWVGVVAVATACGWIIVGTITGVLLGCVLGVVSTGPFTTGFSNGVMIGYWGGILWGTCGVLVKLHKGGSFSGSSSGPFDL